MKLIQTVLFQCLAVSTTVAQFNFRNEWMEKFDLFTSVYALQNPAVSGLNSPAEFRISYKGHSGIYSGIRSFYVQGSLDLKNKIRDSSDVRIKQIIGICALARRDGEFISKSRANAQYGFHVRLKSDWFFSGGIQGGLISYAFLSSSASSGGTSNKLSISTGISFYNRKNTIGLSLNDVNNPLVQPLEQTFQLRRTWMLYVDKRFIIAHRNSLIFSSAFYTETGLHYRGIGLLRLELWNKAGVGIIYSQFNGTSFMMSARNVTPKLRNFEVRGSYKLPFSRFSNLRQTSFEVNLIYSFQ